MSENMKEFLLSKKVSELNWSGIFNSEQSAREGFSKIASAIIQSGARLVSLELFGGDWLNAPSEEFIASFGYEFPVNRILPLDENSKPVLGGAHVIAVKGADVEVVRSSEGDIAAKYSDGEGTEYFRTFGITTDSFPADEYSHTYENISRLERILRAGGYAYTDIVRTWFYNDDILSWYEPFNKARTCFYKERGIFESLLPASTGIGAPNPKHVRIESGAFVIKPRNSSVKAYEIESPLQCGAPEYGSSFSRAVEIDTPSGKRILVSGTASIAPGGETLYQDDISAQVDLTMRVISAMLEARGLSLKDTVRSVSYCLRPEYYEVFKKWLADNGLVDMPHIPSYSIVCRGDLLFEVELEAAVNI